MTQFQFYRTLWYGALRKTLTMPSGLFLLPFSSWFSASRPGTIRLPTLPENFTYSVDSGAYRYRNGHYPYQPLDYMHWCQALCPAPQWVVMPDWFGQKPGLYRFPTRSLNADMYGPHPGSGRTEPLTSHLLFLADLYAAKFQLNSATRIQQVRISLMAYTLWDHYRDAVTCWVPVVQGNQCSDYIWHTRVLLPLIEEMQAYYGSTSAFRVGIGALTGHTPREIVEIVTTVATLLPCGVGVHLFAVKQQDFERFPACLCPSLPILSVDSSQWNGQRIRGTMPGKKAWQESGLKQLEYGYAIALPAYEAKLQAAWTRVQQLPALPPPKLEKDLELERFLELFLLLREVSNHTYQDQSDLLIQL
jgi:hypothetical protein